MDDINITFLISLSIISLGYVIKRIKLIKEEDGVVFSKIIFNLTLPAVILKYTTNIHFELSLILLPIVNISFGIIMALIGLIISRKKERAIKGLMIMTMIGFNVVHFSFPLVEGIWGEAGMQLITLVDAGNAFSIFVLSYILGTIYSPNNKMEDNNLSVKYIGKKLLRSVPLLTYAAALIINFSGIIIPTFFSELIDIIARANVALSLLLLGILLRFKFERTEWRTIIKVLIIRYSVGIFFSISLFFLLPASVFDSLFRIIIAISLILPIGVAIIPFSIELGYNEKITTMLVNLSLIISFILVWIFVLTLSG
jgi:predicted permease